MRVIILAAGYGTRLYPLTVDMPKPLLEINGKPLSNFLVDKVQALKKKFPIEEIRVVSNNKFYPVFCDWKRKYKLAVTVVNDGTNSPKERLGAIGDMLVGFGKEKNCDWLVIGGDNLFEDDLSGFLSFAHKKKPFVSLGVYDLGSKEQAKHFGVLELNRSKRVIGFAEKPKSPQSSLVASCVYFFPRQSLKFFSQYLDQGVNSDTSGAYISWLTEYYRVFGFALSGKWIDIGHTQALNQARQTFKN